MNKEKAKIEKAKAKSKADALDEGVLKANFGTILLF